MAQFSQLCLAVLSFVSSAKIGCLVRLEEILLPLFLIYCPE
jgi:hypothetical protein